MIIFLRGKLSQIQYPLLLQFIIIVCLSSLIKSAFGEMKWRITGEFGTYKAESSSYDSNLNFLSRLGGYLKYQDSKNHSAWLVSLHLKPEYYGSNNLNSIAKLLAKGQYLKKYIDWNWGINFDSRKYFYSLENENITLDIFRLQGMLSMILKRSGILTFQPGYYYRDFVDTYDQKLDAVTTKVEIIKIFSQYFNIGAGFYTEKFTVVENSRSTIASINIQNNGWRFGPNLSIHYQKKLMFSLRYLFLFHHSKVTTGSAHEQYLRLLLGKIILKNWTAFFLIDYYWSYFSFHDDLDPSIYYIPFDNESRVDFKLERLVTKHLILYLKVGYFRDNLMLKNLSAKGWHTLLGFEVGY